MEELDPEWELDPPQLSNIPDIPFPFPPRPDGPDQMEQDSKGIPVSEESSEMSDDEWPVNGMMGITHYFTQLVPKPVHTPKRSIEVFERNWLLDFPREVLERIILMLPGQNVMYLEWSSPAAREVSREILSGTLGSKFWKRRCFEELSSPTLLQVIASHFTVVSELYRYLVATEGWFVEESIFDDARYKYSYYDIYRTVFNLGRMLKTWTMTIEEMRKQDDQIKHEILWNFDKNNPENPYPGTVTDAVGSLLCNIKINPYWEEEQRNTFHVWENMKEIRRHTTKTTFVGEKMLAYKIMTLPLPEGVPDLNSFDRNEPLPKVWRIFIGIFERTICLTPMNTGVSNRIHTHFYPQFNGQFKEMPTPVATLGNYIGVFSSPESYQLYVIYADQEKGDISGEKLCDVHLDGMYRAWQNFALDPQYYVPYMFPRADKSDTPTFAIVSVRDGTNIFDERRQKLDHQKPRWFYTGIKYPNRNKPPIGYPLGCATSINNIVFWDEYRLALCFRGVNWHILPWDDTPVTSTVKLAEIIGLKFNYLMVSTREGIFILEMKYGTKTNGPRAPTIALTLIRRITLDEEANGAYVSQFHFDFDRGQPYIFLIAKLRKDEDADGGKACNFFMKKIKFWNPRFPIAGRAEEKVDFPEIWRSFYMNDKNKRFVAMFKALGVNMPHCVSKPLTPR